MLNKYADIILPVPLPKLFTYEITKDLISSVKPGKRVIVSFGKRKILSGIVYKTHNNKPEAYSIKPILSVLDNLPVVLEKQLKLWTWIANYYQCTLGEVYKAAMPAGLKLESETRIYINPDFNDVISLPPKALEIIDHLKTKKYCTINEINKITGLKSSHHLIDPLIEAEVVLINEKLKSAWQPKTELFLTLHSDRRSEEALHETFDSLNRAPKQLELLMRFLQMSEGIKPALKGKAVLRKKLLGESTNASAIISELLKKDILVQKKIKVEEYQYSDTKKEEQKKLTPEQNVALEKIKDGFKNNKPVLLHGVTSSGKTELYIQLIQETIKVGKQALYLLPEIALTTQITNRLKSSFGDKVGVYHSKFNDNERIEVWNNLLQEKSYKIILGVRSSIFLPFKNLGLIIVDEEHEHSFKQFDPAPRYHARDVALVLGRDHKAKVLLGTATPSIESYYNSQEEKYFLVELNTRYEGLQLPEIIVVNTREAKRKKMMQSHFSPQLINLINEALENKEQVILFQNRRGFAPYLECSVCGWIPKCKHCDVSLTYHKHTNQLICHYCGFSAERPLTCLACGNSSLNYRGFGTQKVEEEIKEIFPKAAIARMDYDTTRSRKGYEKIISGFEQGKYDILIGTQMVTKGLDFDRVSLVGILNADNMLNHPDFRAYEKSFQMMAQVSGRAGRKYKRGTVIIQTSDPENPIINFVCQNDYSAFYKSQIKERIEYKYPPYHRLIYITLRHKNENTTKQAAKQLSNLLKNIFGNRVLGPQVPPITKIQDMHLQRIILKIEREKSSTKAKQLILNCINKINARDQWRYVQSVIDVDPL